MRTRKTSPKQMPGGPLYFCPSDDISTCDSDDLGQVVAVVAGFSEYFDRRVGARGSAFRSTAIDIMDNHQLGGSMWFGLYLTVLAAGCRNYVMVEYLDGWGCVATDSGPALALGETSSLGFSGQEVVDALSGSLSATAVDFADGSVEVHDLTFTVTPEGTAQLQEREASPDGALCLAGLTLALEATLEISANDGWFSGSRPVTLSAQGTTSDQIWVRLFRMEVVPSDELLSVAVERNHDDCTASDVIVRYDIGDEAPSPWSVSVGGLGFDTCSGSGGLYALEPSAR